MFLRPALNLRTRAQQNRVSVADALSAQKHGEGVFVDVRHPDQFNELTGAGFVNIPHFQFRYFAEEAKPFQSLDKQEPIYLLDTWGYYSTLAAKALDRENFGSVNVIDGTFPVFDTTDLTQGGLMTWFFQGGEPVSNLPERQKVIEKYSSLPDNWATVELINKEMEFDIDFNPAYPRANDFFESPEEAAEMNAQPLRK